MARVIHVSISYGLNSGDLVTQLKAQELGFDHDKMAAFQQNLDAIKSLITGGLLSNSQTDRLVSKLNGAIVHHLHTFKKGDANV